MIFALGFKPKASFSLRIFWLVELSLFLFELPLEWEYDEAKNTLDHHS